MIRHLFVAALRNMAANRLQTAIAILGLSVGITAALLMALVIRNQLIYDHFIPGYERIYFGIMQTPVPDRGRFYGEVVPVQGSLYTDYTRPTAAAWLKLNLPEVEGVTRLMLPRSPISGKAATTLRRGQITADETIYWADPNVFDILPLPVFRGDLTNALRRPDGIVLPRAIARKYFGHDDAVGQTILVDGHPMTVRAVIEDLPEGGTSLKSAIFVAGRASFSPMADDEGGPTQTFVRLRPRATFSDVERRLPIPFDKQDGSILRLVRLDQMPLLEIFHPDVKAKLAVAGLSAILILFIAAINFVNLLTVRAARRATEVGIRKVSGAARRALIFQFLGESILTVLFATFIAASLSEWLLPSVNAFLRTGAQFDWKNPLMVGLLVAGITGLGILAGGYPAFVLSSFRPAAVLKGVLMHSTGADRIRNILVAFQFAILIGTAVAATVIYQQDLWATREGLRGNIDQMLIARVPWGSCNAMFLAELRKMPGVAGASCADNTFLDGLSMSVMTYKGKKFYVKQVILDLGIFPLYGIKPLAGSLPSSSAAGDYDRAAPLAIVLNEAAVKRFGFTSPGAAIGATMEGRGGRPQVWKSPESHGPSLVPGLPSTVVAVVPDFSFQSIANQPIAPTVYGPGSIIDFPVRSDQLVNIKLRGQSVPETLTAIDRLSRAIAPGHPITRFFLNQRMQQLYLATLREAQFFALFSGLAIFLACLGLFGFSISMTEHRTKEIGIRKAMGAKTGEIQRLLLWQFVQPILWANLIAWPVAWWGLSRWLSGFAYHVQLSWWLFPAAGTAALLVALASMAAQAWLVARQRPVLALRYE